MVTKKKSGKNSVSKNDSSGTKKPSKKSPKKTLKIDDIPGEKIREVKITKSGVNVTKRIIGNDKKIIKDEQSPSSQKAPQPAVAPKIRMKGNLPPSDKKEATAKPKLATKNVIKGRQVADAGYGNDYNVDNTGHGRQGGY